MWSLIKLNKDMEMKNCILLLYKKSVSINGPLKNCVSEKILPILTILTGIYGWLF